MGDAARDPKELAAEMTASMYRTIEETNARKHLGKWPVDPGQQAKDEPVEEKQPKEDKPVSTKHGWHSTRWMTADEIEAMPEVTVGNRIAKARKKAKLTQTNVIERLGNKMIANWECGTYRPGPESIAKLAKIFGVAETWLMGNEYPDAPPVLEEKPKPKAKPSAPAVPSPKVDTAAPPTIVDMNAAAAFPPPKFAKQPKPLSFEDLLPKEPGDLLASMGIELPESRPEPKSQPLPNFPTYEELLEKLVENLSKNRPVAYVCPCCGKKLELAVALQEVKA